MPELRSHMVRKRVESPWKGRQVSVDAGLRAALYHRFAFLWPLIFSPLTRRLWRVLILGLGTLYFLFILLVLRFMNNLIIYRIQNYL